MKRCLALGLVILAVFSESAFSYDGCQSPEDADLSPCLSLTNYALKDIYDELMNVTQTPLLDEYEKTELRKDELQWLKLRDQLCELKLNTKFHTIDEWMHSIDADKTKSRCVVEQTKKRIVDLEQVKKKKEDAIRQIGNVSVSAEAPNIPNASQDVLAFIPRGYAIFEKVKKDFNGDGLIDVAMILRPTMPNEYNPRPFIILLAQATGGYELSARNDEIAPNGEAGGVSNPYGSDALKVSGRDVVIEETGGSSVGAHGVALVFRFQQGGWYMVGKSEWSESARGDTDVCQGMDAPKTAGAWHCWKHEIATNLASGEVTESWFIHNDDTSQDKTKRHRYRIETSALRSLNSYSIND